MSLLAIAVLAALQLGGGFGEASAEVDELSDESMIVDIQVEVGVSADAVVAHLSFDNDPPVVIPLLDRGGGLYGVRTELEPKNYQVVFEAVGSAGVLSEAVSLVRLGADLEQALTANGGEGDPPANDDDGLSVETQRMGWLALALAAASLSALAFWTLAGRESKDSESERPVEG